MSWLPILESKLTLDENHWPVGTEHYQCTINSKSPKYYHEGTPSELEPNETILIAIEVEGVGEDFVKKRGEQFRWCLKA